MKFADWVATNGISNDELARKLGVTRAYVWYLSTGNRTPSLPMAMLIRDVSGGKVKPEDWPRP